MNDIDYRLAEHDIDDIPPERIEAARREAFRVASNHTDATYSSGFIDGVILLDRMLTDPQYFGLDNE